MVRDSQLNSIGAGAFGYCVSLASVDFPASLENIGEQSFIVCDSLTSIVFPALLSPSRTINIGKEVFLNYSSLNHIRSRAVSKFSPAFVVWALASLKVTHLCVTLKPTYTPYVTSYRKSCTGPMKGANLMLNRWILLEIAGCSNTPPFPGLLMGIRRYLLAPLLKINVTKYNLYMYMVGLITFG